MSEYPINQRLRQFIKFKRLTVQKFESVCGFSNGYVNSIRKTPGADKLEAIVRVFPDLNREWLLTGEGEMVVSEAVTEAPSVATPAGISPALLDKALDEIAAQRRMMEKSQEQIDRLLAIIEGMTGRPAQ